MHLHHACVFTSVSSEYWGLTHKTKLSQNNMLLLELHPAPRLRKLTHPGSWSCWAGASALLQNSHPSSGWNTSTAYFCPEMSPSLPQPSNTLIFSDVSDLSMNPAAQSSPAESYGSQCHCRAQHCSQPLQLARQRSAVQEALTLIPVAGKGTNCHQRLRKTPCKDAYNPLATLDKHVIS